MGDPKPLRIDLLFVMALALSGMTTVVLALAFWNGSRIGGSLSKWGALWLFTVAGPAIEALRLHRRLKQLLEAVPGVPEAVRRDLALARSSFLIFGNVTVAMAFALGLGGY